MAKAVEHGPKVIAPVKWNKFFDDLGVNVEFADYTDPIVAYSYEYAPGVRVTTSPIKNDDMQRVDFVENLRAKLFDEVLYKVFGYDKDKQKQFRPGIYLEDLDYDGETGILSLTVFEKGDDDEFESVIDEYLFSMGSKNELPL